VKRCHPKNPWISNPVAARLLIFMTRHRLPVVSRLFIYFLGCDIGAALPKTVVPASPDGYRHSRRHANWRQCLIGHQVTLGGRDVTGAAPQVEDGVYIGAGAKILGGVRIVGGPPSAPTPWSPGMSPLGPPWSAPTVSYPSPAPTRLIEWLG